MPIYYGDGLPTRAYALEEQGGTNFSQGNQQETGGDLDMAINGPGYIAVQAPDGSEAYTRAGALQTDEFGALRTVTGLPVIGNGGPITIPPAQKIEIGRDGSITIHAQGQKADALVQIDRIKLVNPAPNTVKKSTDGLFRVMDGKDVVTAPPDINVTVNSGFIEGSNVNAVSELTGMLTLARQYEMHVKMMSTVEKDSESAARLLQLNG